MPSARSPVHNGMKKIVLMGRSEAGKTTLTQALKGEKIQYHKTQYVNNFDVIIDTPGEYAQTKNLGHALALYTYEADVAGLLVSAIEPYCLYPPCITNMCNREVIGIVTKIHHPEADVARAEDVDKRQAMTGSMRRRPPMPDIPGRRKELIRKRS